MPRILTAAAVFALLAAVAAAPVHAQAGAAKKTARKANAGKAEVEPVVATNDQLAPGQLSVADRVLTGIASCEFKQKVDIEKIEGHAGNFRLTFDHRSYVMVPEETTTGAVRLVDTSGAIIWLQIPRKSMLMNQKTHQRMVDDCEEDEQRIAVQAAASASANAPSLAPAVAPPAAPAAAGATTTTRTTTTTTTVRLVPPEAVPHSAAPPDAAASGMWK
jgi:hypothetical protein